MSAFTFGAPAPATPAFGATPAPAFGAAPAPAFGAAPAPAFGASPAPAFGAAPAPAFGAAPAPAFGAAPAPAFGAAPAPAFGAAPAPAFGAAPAPAFGTAPAPGAAPAFGAPPAAPLFGGTPAPAPLFGAPAAPAGFFTPAVPPTAATPTQPSFFAPQPQQPQPTALQPPPEAPFVLGHTPYPALPDNAKKAIDEIHKLMLEHRRTMATVKTMVPTNLPASSTTGIVAAVGGADEAAGSPSRAASAPLLPHAISEVSTEASELDSRMATSVISSQQLHLQSANAVRRAVLHGAWTAETLAARRGLNLRRRYVAPTSATRPKKDDKKDHGEKKEDLDFMLRRVIEQQAASMDRIEVQPSPFLWEELDDLDQRLRDLGNNVDALRRQIDAVQKASTDKSDAPAGAVSGEIATTIRNQASAFLRVASVVAKSNEAVDGLRNEHRRQGYAASSSDPFAAADAAEADSERRMQERLRSLVASSVPAAELAGAPTPSTPAPATAPAPPASGSTPAPAAPAAGLFGAPVPAPATTTSTTAATPAAGGLFANPAPAPPAAGGGLLGGAPNPAPAPATGGLFGVTPAPPPAGGAAPASVFGATPAAPASAFSFGAPPPAPAPSTPAAFGAAPPATPGAATTSRSSRNRGRTGSRRR